MQKEGNIEVFIASFVVVMTFIGLLYWFVSGEEDEIQQNTSNTVKIDCNSLYASQNNPYCNGEAVSDFERQDGQEDSYYQDLVR